MIMKRALIWTLTLLFLFSGVNALEIEKAIINVDPLGRASIEYTLLAESSKLESIEIPKPIGEVFLLDEFDNKIDFRKVEGNKINEIVFTSSGNKTKLIFDTFLLVNKIGEFWYFNVSLPAKQGATVLISLPQSAVIESIEGTDRTFTYAGTKTLVIESKTQSNNFEIEVKYFVQDFNVTPPIPQRDYTLVFVVVLFGFLGLIIVLYFKFKNEIKAIRNRPSRKKTKPKKTKGKSIKDSVKKVLDQNEEKVVFYLKDVVDASHSQIHRATKLPKTTLTKVIIRLEKRNIIKKIPFGNRSRLSLEDWVFES